MQPKFLYVTIHNMPIIKSATKKMLQDRKRTKHNKQIKDQIKGLIKNTRREPSEKNLSEAASALDKAVKTKLIHKNTASRLKSRLAKLFSAAK